MIEQHAPVPSAAPDRLPEQLPPVLRIQSIARLPFDERLTLSRAVLFHERASLTVEWLSRQADVRLTRGSLVAIRWQGRPTVRQGALRVARLILLERPDAATNLFHTVPTGWVADRDLVCRAAALWGQLPRPFAHLFNAVFWDGHRFGRFVGGPSSLAGHHNRASGNLAHTVEVAEGALALAGAEPLSCPAVLLMAALLHDAGKADEYRLDRSRGRFEMSDRGRLVGHRHTVLEWLAAARAQHRVIVPEAHYLALLHALTCAKGAPAWLGLREPQSLDATLLSMADRFSGERDLVHRHAPGEAGFGRYHAHLRGRPFVVPALP